MRSRVWNAPEVGSVDTLKALKDFPGGPRG